METLKIILLCLTGAIVYGIVHDQVTARVYGIIHGWTPSDLSYPVPDAARAGMGRSGHLVGGPAAGIPARHCGASGTMAQENCQIIGHTYCYFAGGHRI